jgi:PAS domain S-box-containing protein
MPQNGKSTPLESESLNQVFNGIANNAPLGIIVIQNGGVLFVNEELARLIGYSSTELQQMTANDFLQFVSDADKLEASRRIKLAFEGKVKTQLYELQVKDKEGELRWLQVLPRLIAINEKPAILAMVLEATEQKRIEQAYRDLVDNSLQGHLIIQDMSVVFANQAFADISGYTIEELHALTPKEVEAHVHPEYRARVWGRMKDRLAGKPVPSHYQFKAIRKDGKERWVEMYVSLIEYNGKPAVQCTFIDITERQEADIRLQESEARYHGLFDELPLGLYQTTHDGQIIEVNPALIKLLGAKDKDTLLKMNASEFYLNPEDREQWKELLAQEGIVPGHEVQFKRLDGTAIWVLDTFRAIRNEDGTVKYYEGSLQDITERKVAEQALKERERRYRALFENTNDAIFLISLDLKQIEANQRAADMLGYTIDELNKLKVSDLVIESEYEDSLRVQKALLAGERVPIYERTLQKKNGEEFIVETNASLVTDAEGNPLFLQSAMRDITERKQAEEAILESEMKYRTLIETSPDAITVTDLEGKIVMVNRQAIRMYGVKEEQDVIGKSAFIMIAKEDVQRAVENLQKTLQEGVSGTLEYSLLRHDGTTYPAEMNAALLKDADGTPTAFIAVIRDISERKEAEAEYQRLFNSVPVGLFRTTPEGEILDANIALVSMLGYTQKEELLKRKASEFYVDPKARKSWEEHVTKEEVVRRVETQFRRADGKIIWIALNARGIPDSSGKVQFYEGTIEDITERKQAEMELKESEAKKAALLEAIPDLTFICDSDGRILSYKALSDSDLYLPANEFLGKTAREVLPEEVAAKIEKHISIALKTKELQCFEYQLPVQNQMREWEARMVVSGEAEVFVLVRDITERKQAEQTLKESELKYRTLVEQSLQGTVIFQNNRVVFANSQIHEIVGLTREELLALSPNEIWDLIHDEDRELLQQRLRDRFAGKPTPPRYEFRIRLKDGSIRWIEILNHLIEYNKEPALQATMMNITERKQAEQAVVESEQKYRMLVEQSQHGILISSGEPPRIFFANPAYCKMTGYTLEELLTMSPKRVAEMVHPDDRELVISRAIERMKGKAVPNHYEYRMIRKDRTVRWVEVFASLTKYEGEPAIQSLLSDITERKTAEWALRESEEKFRTLVEEISDWVWTFDTKGRFIYSNNAVEDILGFSAGQVLGQTPCDFLRPEDKDRGQQLFDEIIKEKKPIRTLVIEFLHRDGSVIILEAKGRPILNEEGELDGYRGICRDITDRIKMIEQIRALEDRF